MPVRMRRSPNDMPQTLNVLFVCEANSARSIMAEALLNRFGAGRFRAFSAGLDPASEVHPLALEIAHASGIATGGLRPKSVREFASNSAPRMDFVIALGKNAAPALPGEPMYARWGISDPMATDGDLKAHRLAFRRAWRELETRIKLFVLLRHRREERDLAERRQARSA
jgi:arsenate reductase (thioredoxin)